MAIGSCDCCDRQDVPVSHLKETYCGDVTACFLCQGDDDPDPYGELEDRREAQLKLAVFRSDALFQFYSAERRAGACPLVANERMLEFSKRLDSQCPFEREQELVAQIMESSS